jgi:hypothetical protein
MVKYSEANKANEAALARQAGAYSSGFEDFLTMKTLARKRINMFGNPFGANAHALAFSTKKELVRNLCVRVDAVRLAELDALTEVLDCNKQEFVMELLVAGIEQAKEALASQGLQQIFDECVDQRIADAGFTMEPAATEGFWTMHHRGEPIVNKDYERHANAARAVKDLVEKELPQTGE